MQVCIHYNVCVQMQGLLTIIHTHAHIHVHSPTRTHAHTHTHTHAKLHTRTPTHTPNTHPYAHTYTHAHTFTHAHTNTHIHIHTYTHTYTHMHTYTYTHIHTTINTPTHTKTKNTNAYMHGYLAPPTNTPLNACVFVCVHVCSYVCMHVVYAGEYSVDCTCRTYTSCLLCVPWPARRSRHTLQRSCRAPFPRDAHTYIYAYIHIHASSLAWQLPDRSTTGVFTIIIIFSPYWWLSYNKLLSLSLQSTFDASAQTAQQDACALDTELQKCWCVVGRQQVLQRRKPHCH